MSVGRLLLVDDDPDTCALLSLYLSRRGVDVHAVGSLAEARNELRNGAFEALLTDLELPDGDGRTLLYEGRPRGLRTAIVVSGHSGAAERERSTSLGFDAHLTKPIDQRALWELLTGAMTGGVPGSR